MMKIEKKKSHINAQNFFGRLSSKTKELYPTLSHPATTSLVLPHNLFQLWLHERYLLKPQLFILSYGSTEIRCSVSLSHDVAKEDRPLHKILLK